MNTATLLENSNLLVIRAVENLNETLWEVPGACGEWSVKDIIAHLASYERVIVDVLQTFLDKQSEPTPYLASWIKQREEFNAAEVKERRYATAQQVEDEYQDTQVQATSLLQQIPEATIRQRGTMDWYKQDYCLADFIDLVSKHIQEHCNQIANFRKNADPALE